ncbi:MAG: cation transporter [Deltaproteobacteria bacterium]|nr:cation transporter [Deltaproteobacteria bacterium]
MGDCCEDKACEITALRGRQGAVLKAVLFINAVMFFVEGGAGVMAHSNALVADSLDMLGDALVYGFSLYVLSRGPRWQAGSALLKGLIMAGFGLFALASAVYHIIRPALPVAEAIGGVGLLVLAANSICLFMLWRHRSDDINMHSVWLCSRNDIIANVSVIFAGIGVWLTAGRWPDLLVGLGISFIFLRSAFHVISRAAGELRLPQV